MPKDMLKHSHFYDSLDVLFFFGYLNSNMEENFHVMIEGKSDIWNLATIQFIRIIYIHIYIIAYLSSFLTFVQSNAFHRCKYKQFSMFNFKVC